VHQNYPNPFNPVTQFQFDLPQAGAVKLAIYDMVGHLVRTLVSGEYAAGRHHAIWDATDGQGMKVGSGIYFCRFESNQFVAVKKVVLVR
jgi:flagellar hook assembly protein FlgD